MIKTIPALAAVAMIAAMSTPTLATEWIDCSDATNQVTIGVLLGGLDFTQMSRAHLFVGEETWSTDVSIEPGTPILIGDAYFDWKQLLVKLTDDNAETVLAELRVYVIDNDKGDAKGGVLSVPGRGAWAVECVGP